MLKSAKCNYSVFMENIESFFSWKFKFKQYPNLSIFPIVLIFSYLAIASFLVTTITKLNSQSRICHDYIKRRVKMFFKEYPTNRSMQIKLNNNEGTNQSIFLPVTTMEYMLAVPRQSGYDNCYIFYARKPCLVFAYIRFKEKR